MRGDRADAVWPVTLHASGDAAVVSSGDGASRTVTDPQFLERVRSLVETSKPGSPSRLSAAALASMEEATRVMPVRRPPLSLTRFAGEPFVLPPSLPPSGSFASVLDRRVSRRELGSFEGARLAGVLFTAARIRAVDEAVGSSRPAPSAGACHPFDLLVAVEDVADIPRGWWWFDPWTCRLHSGEATLPADEYLERLREAAEATARPPAAVVLIADLDRTVERYPEGSTLAWRDAGALLAVLQLSATSHGLASCILGASGVLWRASSTSTVQDLGALIVGSSLT